ncbi:MAG TPA: MBL fold metallo-hydrolase [Pyrinomonadaceae bacterium]|nr:MBL fold metallo-hydrolase [Pyrinomonadaceae bacterium]
MRLGDYRVEIIPDTEFRLDGGAMFGVVPRVVWERVSPPDEKNRIRMNMNCVFIDTGKDKMLIETGIGEKWTAKQTEMYGIFREKPLAETLFERTGCLPEDITIVVNTHLHFDHAGGNTVLTGTHASRVHAGGTPVLQSKPQFPNARYLVSASEVKHADDPHERDRASYLSENWEPMREAGQLELMADDYEVVPGLKMQTIRGHSETMQTWRLDRGGKTLYGFADLIPTRHHVPLPWIMGYDLYPTETLAFKKEILPQALDEDWLCLFYHDIDRPISRINEIDGKVVAVPINTSEP